MERLFDAVTRAIPQEMLPALLALGIAFFGIYYYVGYRSYTDVLHSKAFLSLATVIVAGALLFHINWRPRTEDIIADAHQVIIVPNFENDERDQYKKIFLQHIRSSFSDAGLDADSVIEIDSFLSDRRSAEL